MNAISVRHDLRVRFGRPRDQGSRATCVAFAVSDSHAATRGAPWTPLSCEYLFYHAKQRDGTSVNEGTTVPAVQAALREDGQPIETGWAYLRVLPANIGHWRPPAAIGPVHRHPSQRREHSFQRVWEAIESGTPPVICMTISAAFFGPDREGVVDASEPEEPQLRHAVVAVGTGQRGTLRHVLVRNSWGESWGLSGHAWLSERYAAPRFFVALAIQ
jgi:hypothetical protein